MTWQELKEEAKKMGYQDKGEELVKYVDGKAIRFFVEGHVFCFSNIIARERTPDQMLAIMKALQ